MNHVINYQLPVPYGYIAAGISLLALLAIYWLAAILHSLRA